MRAFEGPHRVKPWRRLAAILAVATLSLSVVGGGTTIAADTRILYVGSLLDANGEVIDVNEDGVPDNHLILKPTAVTQGGSTKTDITVLNGDNQNIAHVVLFIPTNGTTLADDLTVSYVFGEDAGPCEPTGSTSVTSVVCDFGNLAAGAMRTVSILVDVASEFSLPSPANLLTANVETNNENGSNNQIFEATSGAFSVDPATNDALGTFLEPNLADPQTLGTTGGVGTGNQLNTAVTFQPSQANGNLVAITEVADGDLTEVLYNCPPGLTCQPDSTTVDIDDGTAAFGTAPFLTWRLTALVPKTFVLTKAFVAHYPTGSTASDWQLFVSKKSDKCGADPGAAVAAHGQCILSATLSKPDRVTGLSTFIIVVLTDHNGGMRF